MTTANLREALRKRYALPEWVMVEEVRDAAGFESKRSADAIAMCMWPSRGLEIHGFELKASRSDWLRELKNPAKAEAIAAYCDRWWIVAMPACVKTEELPVGWGLLELKANGLATVKAAPSREDVKPLTRTFVAAMMRRVGEHDEWLLRLKTEQLLAEGEAQRKRWAEQEVERRTQKASEIVKRLEEIQADTGIDLLSWSYDRKAVGASLRYALSAYDVIGHYGGLTSIQTTMKSLIRQIDALGPLVPADEPDNDNREAA